MCWFRFPFVYHPQAPTRLLNLPPLHPHVVQNELLLQVGHFFFKKIFKDFRVSTLVTRKKKLCLNYNLHQIEGITRHRDNIGCP